MMVAIIIFGLLAVGVILCRNYNTTGTALGALAPIPVSTNKSPVATTLMVAGCSAGGGPVGGAVCNSLLKTKYGGASANVLGSVPTQVKDLKFTGSGSFTSGLEYAVEPWRW